MRGRATACAPSPHAPQRALAGGSRGRGCVKPDRHLPRFHFPSHPGHRPSFHAHLYQLAAIQSAQGAYNQFTGASHPPGGAPGQPPYGGQAQQQHGQYGQSGQSQYNRPPGAPPQQAYGAQAPYGGATASPYGVSGLRMLAWMRVLTRVSKKGNMRGQHVLTRRACRRLPP